MNIEFHTAYKKVPEKLLRDTRDALLKLSHINKISQEQKYGLRWRKPSLHLKIKFAK